jgi:hypothetical protein
MPLPAAAWADHGDPGIPVQNAGVIAGRPAAKPPGGIREMVLGNANFASEGPRLGIFSHENFPGGWPRRWPVRNR